MSHGDVTQLFRKETEEALSIGVGKLTAMAVLVFASPQTDSAHTLETTEQRTHTHAHTHAHTHTHTHAFMVTNGG